MLYIFRYVCIKKHGSLEVGPLQNRRFLSLFSVYLFSFTIFDSLYFLQKSTAVNHAAVQSRLFHAMPVIFLLQTCYSLLLL